MSSAAVSAENHNFVDTGAAKVCEAPDRRPSVLLAPGALSETPCGRTKACNGYLADGEVRAPIVGGVDRGFRVRGMGARGRGECECGLDENGRRAFEDCLGSETAGATGGDGVQVMVNEGREMTDGCGMSGSESNEANQLCCAFQSDRGENGALREDQTENDDDCVLNCFDDSIGEDGVCCSVPLGGCEKDCCVDSVDDKCDDGAFCKGQVGIVGEGLECGCGASGSCSNKKNGEDQTCCLARFDENPVSDDRQITAEAQSEILVSQPCLETCSSSKSAAGSAIDGLEESLRMERSGLKSIFRVSEGFPEERKHEHESLNSVEKDERNAATHHNDPAPVQCEIGIPYMNHNMHSTKPVNENHFVVASEYDYFGAFTVVGNGSSFDERNITNKLCGSAQLGACEEEVAVSDTLLDTSISLINCKTNSGNSMDRVDSSHSGIASECSAEPSATERIDSEYGACGPCSDGSRMEDHLCKTCKQGEGYVSEIFEELSVVEKNEVGDGRGVSRNYVNMVNVKNQLCGLVQCEGQENVGLKNDIHGVEGTWSVVRACSKEALTSTNNRLDGLNCQSRHGSNVNCVEPLLCGTEVRCEVNGLCSTGSNAEICFCNSAWEKTQNKDQVKQCLLDSLDESHTGQERIEGGAHLVMASDVSTSSTTQFFLKKESPSTLMEGPFNAASSSAVELSASPRACHLLGNLNPSTFKHSGLDTRDIAFGCSDGSSGNAVNGTKVEMNLNSILGNDYTCQSNQLSRTRKAARQFRREVDIARIFLSNAKRKRSSCKKPRLSVWGTLGTILQLFQRNDEIHGTQQDQILTQGVRKGRGGAGSKRHKASAKGTKAKSSASTNHVRSRVKKERKGGKTSVDGAPPDVINTVYSFISLVDESLPKSDSQACFQDLETTVERKHIEGGDGHVMGLVQCQVRDFEKLEMPADVYLRDALHCDRDLESTVTQDTSVENTSGDCLGICSLVGYDVLGEAVDNKHLDPETSPDSDVLHVLPDVGGSAGEGISSSAQKAFTYARRRFRNNSSTESTAVKPLDGSVSSQAGTAAASVAPSNMRSTIKKKGKKTAEGGPNQAVQFGTVEEKMLSGEKPNKPKKLTKRKPARKAEIGFDPCNTLSSITGGASSMASNSEVVAMNPSMPETEHLGEVLKGESGMETRILSGKDVGTSQPVSWILEGISHVGKVNGCKLPNKSKAGGSKHRSKAPSSGNVHGRKENRKSKGKDIGLSDQIIEMVEGHIVAPGDESGEAGIRETGKLLDLGKANTNNVVASEGMLSSIVSPIGNAEELNKCPGLDNQHMRPRRAWVLCDDCHKWRFIPAELADEIEATDCRWTCKDNQDQKFADCLIPQEKSNAEINAELEISDASCEDDSCSARPNSKRLEHRQLTATQQASWTLIKSNLFLHRSRRTQTIDEVMVCHCKLPTDGSLGCGEECLNRMLSIECVQGTCPCGDLCSNQQFQKRNYANLKWFRCGKKGYGLQLLEDVSEGSFLIEYVGEVLDISAYEARQREYALRGQKHFYFMTLNGSEVIDACSEGNLGRFINHSCDPNCRTEKWMVNGEVCIGLFAIRDIKKGEEVTFDYNYVRVFGAAAKKCVCGSSDCRGYIGGDPSNSEVIVQGDSDDDYPEPIMICEDGEIDDDIEDVIHSNSSVDAVSMKHEVPFETMDNFEKLTCSIQESERSTHSQESRNKSAYAVEQVELPLQCGDDNKNFIPAKLEFGTPLRGDVMGEPSFAVRQFEGCLENEDAKRTSFNTIQSSDISSLSPSATDIPEPGIVEDGSKSISDNKDKSVIPKTRPRVKSSCLSRSIKKEKCSAAQGIANKPKRLAEGAGCGHFEGVEEKLNELLDAEGGISKRKDATKGYLKLLLVTAASGDNVNGETIQSTRDLSIVLDAILKTKSRMVLMDIISKNGLQMLHNIMKLHRKNFNKIPIIRKLLKVLEFLANKGVLTREHINTAPPCAGMESFKDSILILTRHNDSQVQKIARNFRETYIPRTIRRINFTDRDEGRFESQNGFFNRCSASHRRWLEMRHTDAICVSEATSMPMPMGTDEPEGMCFLPAQSGIVIPIANYNAVNGTKRTHKRKSRWDQPSEVNLDPWTLDLVEDQASSLKVGMSSHETEINQASLNQATEIQNETKCCISDEEQIDHDVPPGFSSPLKNSHVAPDYAAVSASCEVVPGLSQKRFLPHLPVSYGIPLWFVEKLGTPKEAAGDGWVIAPGVPFHPFPPLPKYPRGLANPLVQPSPSTCIMMADGIRDEMQLTSLNHMDSNAPGIDASVGPQEAVAACSNHLQSAEKAWCSSGGLGRRYFRQQKRNDWFNWKHKPPWLRPRNGWGFRGNRNMWNGGTAMRSVVNETKEVAGGLCPVESVNNCSNDIDITNSQQQ